MKLELSEWGRDVSFVLTQWIESISRNKNVKCGGCWGHMGGEEEGTMGNAGRLKPR